VAMDLIKKEKDVWKKRLEKLYRKKSMPGKFNLEVVEDNG
jgi:hypothetical protein